MKKNLIITGIGATLLTTGIIGGIWSGINVMPKFINDSRIADEKYQEKETLFNEALSLTGLKLNLPNSDVTIKKSENQNIIIERVGNKEVSSFELKEENGILSVNEIAKQEEHRELKNIDDLVQDFVDDIHKRYYSSVTIYIPNSMDLDIKCDNFVDIDDSVEATNLNITSNNGFHIHELAKIENLNVSSESHLNLEVRSLLGRKNVNINANSITIDSENEDLIIDDIENLIPENLSIKASGRDYENVRILSHIPLAKNLKISSSSNSEIKLPIMDYDFNFDIKANQGIDFNHMRDNEYYYNTELEKYFLDDASQQLKEFKGYLITPTNNKVENQLNETTPTDDTVENQADNKGFSVTINSSSVSFR